MTRHVGSATVLVVLVALAAFTGAAAAASNGSLTADPSGTGETATHAATVTVGSNATGSWNGFQVDYTAGDAAADTSDVGVEDVVTAGIDRGDDQAGTAVDVNVSDDLDEVKTSNNGKTLTFVFGGSYDLQAGDEVVVVYEDAVNPSSAGDYAVTLDVNHQSSGGQVTAEYAVGESGDGNATTTAADDTTTSTTAGGTATTTDGGNAGAGDTTTATTESESGGTPGFTLGVGALALLGAALVVARRD